MTVSELNCGEAGKQEPAAHGEVGGRHGAVPSTAFAGSPALAGADPAREVSLAPYTGSQRFLFQVFV